MSTKVEQTGVGTASRTPDHGSGGESTTAEASRSLPSVIVDPSINLGAHTPASGTDGPANGTGHGDGDGVTPQAEVQKPQPAAGAGAASAAQATAGGEVAPQADLSAADADRFAARIRPSWEAPLPTPVPTASRSSRPAPSPRAPAALAYEPELDVSEFPGARQRRRNLLMAGAAVAGFALLAFLALRSSGTGSPQMAKLAPVESKTSSARDNAPVTHEPALPSAAPVAAPPPQPPEAVAAPAPIAERAPAATDGTPAPTLAIAPAAAVPVATAIAAQPAQPSEPLPTQAPPPTASPAPARPQAEQPSLMRILVTSVPEDAELTLDGARVPNPFDTRMPRGGKHKIHAQAAGYHSKDLTLNFDRDQEVAIRLERRETAKPTRAVSAAPAKTLAVTRPRRPPPPPAAPARTTFPPYRRPAPTPANKGAGFVTESPY